MSRRVKKYLSNLTVITNEDELREMSLSCEPPPGSGMILLSWTLFESYTYMCLLPIQVWILEEPMQLLQKIAEYNATIKIMHPWWLKILSKIYEQI
jgi:hypothetical protein